MNPPFYVWTADGDCQNTTDDFAEACRIALELWRKGAYVTDVDHAVHRAAWEPASDDARPQTSHMLADSLACYATGDDIVLTRKQFLRMVVDRIEDDLRDETF